MAALFSNNVPNYNPANFGNGASFMQHLNQMNPQMNYTVDAFNKANASNPQLAFLMASQGGQQFRNQIMQQNGWDQNKMNQWINNTGYNQGGLIGRGMTPQNIAALQGFGATMAPQTYRNYGNATNNQSVGQNNMAGGGTNYPAGYTGYGNSVLSGSNNTTTGSNTPPPVSAPNPNVGIATGTPSGGALSAVQQLLNQGNQFQVNPNYKPSTTIVNPFTGQPVNQPAPVVTTPTPAPSPLNIGFAYSNSKYNNTY